MATIYICQDFAANHRKTVFREIVVSLVIVYSICRQILFAKIVGTKEALYSDAAREYKAADGSTFVDGTFTVSQ